METKSSRLRLLFVTCLLAIAPCHAAPPIDVTIYADNGYPPYSYEENGQIKGIYTEIVSRAVKKMPGYRVTIMPVPWKRGLMLLETGDGFALYPPYYRPDERPYMKYSEPILAEQVVVFCNKAVVKARNLKEWPDDYFGLTIGTNAGFILGGKRYWQAVGAGKLRHEANSTSHASLLKLLMGRIDCYINDRLSILWEIGRIQHAAESGDVGGDVKETANVSSEQGYLGYTDRDLGRFPFKDDFIKKFNAAIADMKQSGEIRKLIEDFLNDAR